MNIMEKIIKELDLKKLKRADLARHLGKSTGQIPMWEKRGTTPPAELIPDIADFLNVSTDYLLGRDKPNTPEVTESDVRFAMLNSFDTLNNTDKKLVMDIIESLKNKNK